MPRLAPRAAPSTRLRKGDARAFTLRCTAQSSVGGRQYSSERWTIRVSQRQGYCAAAKPVGYLRPDEHEPIRPPARTQALT